MNSLPDSLLVAWYGDDFTGAALETRRLTHKTIASVTTDLEGFRFNRVVARIRELTNHLSVLKAGDNAGSDAVSLGWALHEGYEAVVRLLAPMTPHLAEELWQLLGGEGSLAYQDWPEYDESLTVDDLVEIPVQVQGKLRGKIQAAPDSSAEQLEEMARGDEKIAALLADCEVVKVITVPGRLVNFVIK